MKHAIELSRPAFTMINYNMRCIETANLERYGKEYVKDKLQHEMYWNDGLQRKALLGNRINYNMRCIETMPYEYSFVKNRLINYNMRCIETIKDSLLYRSTER